MRVAGAPGARPLRRPCFGNRFPAAVPVTLLGLIALAAAHQPVDLAGVTGRASHLGGQQVELAVAILCESEHELLELLVDHEVPLALFGVGRTGDEYLAAGCRERLAPVAEHVVTLQLGHRLTAIDVATRDRDAALLHTQVLIFRYARVGVHEDRIHQLLTPWAL